MHRLLPQVRIALRAMRRAPWFTAAAIVSLALGIGAHTAIFTLLDHRRDLGLLPAWPCHYFMDANGTAPPPWKAAGRKMARTACGWPWERRAGRSHGAATVRERLSAFELD